MIKVLQTRCIALRGIYVTHLIEGVSMTLDPVDEAFLINKGFAENVSKAPVNIFEEFPEDLKEKIGNSVAELARVARNMGQLDLNTGNMSATPVHSESDAFSYIHAATLTDKKELDDYAKEHGYKLDRRQALTRMLTVLKEQSTPSENEAI